MQPCLANLEAPQAVRFGPMLKAILLRFGPQLVAKGCIMMQPSLANLETPHASAFGAKLKSRWSVGQSVGRLANRSTGHASPQSTVCRVTDACSACVAIGIA